MGTALVGPTAQWWRWRHGARTLRAGCVGLGIATGLLLVERLLLQTSTCRDVTGFGCLDLVVAWSVAAPFVSFFLGWGVLRIVGVRPAWPAALLGAGLSWYLLKYLTVLFWLPGGADYVRLALQAAAFALAGGVTASLRPWWPRAAAAVALALVVPLNSLADTRISDQRQDSSFSAAGVPLLGPQVPAGYHLEGTGTETNMNTVTDAETEPTFFYRVAPDNPGSGATTMAQLEQNVQVTVAPVQSGFSPPSDCVAIDGDYPAPSHACTAVAPGVWRWDAHHYFIYFVRVGDTVAAVEADSPPVSEAVLTGIAESMRVRPPSYFTGG